MSTQITTAMVDQYARNVFEIAQQKESRLRKAVLFRHITGDVGYFDQIGKQTMNPITSRHANTPQNDTPHTRRRVDIKWYNVADLLDTADNAALLIDPKNSYVQSQAYAAGRKMDNIIAAAMRGTAKTGHAGGTSTALPSSQKIAHASAGLTLAKLRSAKNILDGNDVPDENRYFALTAYQLQDLLGITQIQSADYNTIRALVAGEVDTFMGFKFIRTEELTTSSSVTYCLAWHKTGVMLGMSKDIKADIGVRRDKNMAWQAYTEMGLGATRMEEVKVVEVACYES